MAWPEQMRTQARTAAGDRCHHLERKKWVLTVRVIRLGCWGSRRTGVTVQSANIHHFQAHIQCRLARSAPTGSFIKTLYSIFCRKERYKCYDVSVSVFLFLCLFKSTSPRHSIHKQEVATMFKLCTTVVRCPGVFIWPMCDILLYKDGINK